MTRRFRVLAGLGGASALLAVVTLVSGEWIELVFRVEPDGGSGAAEWLAVAVLAAAAAACALAARVEWRRAAAAAAA